MIILNTVNNENKTIEYHFTHDDFKGSVFKINVNFDLVTENNESYLTCEYKQLKHEMREEITNEEVKRVCDEFAMATLQTLLGLMSEKVAGDVDVGK